MTPNEVAFDEAWKAVIASDALKDVRIKLSVHNLRSILQAAVPAALSGLNKWADGFSDRQLAERAASEAVIAEQRAEIERLQARVAELEA